VVLIHTDSDLINCDRVVIAQRGFLYTINCQPVLLSYENIAHYLMEKDLIELKSVINGTFSVRDQSSRNVNYVVNQEYSPAYLVKQVRTHDQEKQATLRKEATCYWLANNDQSYLSLRKFLPRFIEYDYLHHILILELLPDTQNLREYYRSKGILPVAFAEKLADLLASFHNYADNVLESEKSFSLFKKQKPWVFSLSEDKLSEWQENPALSKAEKQSGKLILENKEFLDHLDRIKNEWEIKSLVHGDVKFPNFLVNSGSLSEEEPDIRLIDWELADIGDPLWDVAAVIQSYLTLWILSEIEQKNKEDKFQVIINLNNVQPSIAAFWRRYTASVHWEGVISHQYLKKTVRFTALKLIHTCFESVHEVTNMSLYSAKILQLSLNLLRRPDEAIRDLLGIRKPLANHAKTDLS